MSRRWEKADLKVPKRNERVAAFAPLPFAVIRSQGFARLSAHAVKLVIDLLAQYKGDNNGDLCAAWTIMQGRGWKSKETLNKALKELKEGDWVEVTRQGGRHKASLYGLTFYAVDDCNGKLDVRSTSSPRSTWKKNEPLPAMPKLKVVPFLAGNSTALQVADANAISGGTPSVSIAR